MINIIGKLFNNELTSESEVLSFVKYVMEIMRPDYKYSERITLDAFSLGYKNKIISGLLNDIAINPMKFNLDVNILYAENQTTILKVYVYDNKPIGE